MHTSACLPRVCALIGVSGLPSVCGSLGALATTGVMTGSKGTSASYSFILIPLRRQGLSSCISL